MEKLINNLTEMSFSLLNNSLNKSQDGFVLSAYSILHILGMLLNGAENETKMYIQNLIIKNETSEKINFEISKLTNLIKEYINDDKLERCCQSKNFLFFIDKLSILPLFKKNLLDYYKTSIQPLNTNDEDIINTSVSDNTNGKIQKIVESLPANFEAMFLNTTFFNGKWLRPFTEKFITKDFTVGNKIYKVPMMSQNNKFRNIETETYQAIQLDYSDPSFCFLGVIPKNNISLEEVSNSINKTGGVTNLLLEMKEDQIYVEIPKFTITSKIDLHDDIFDEDSKKILLKSRFSEMFYCKNLGCPEIKQVAVVEVDENGTVASVATKAVFLKSCLHSNKSIFFNRPFLFFIVKTFIEKDEVSETISLPLFLGRYAGKDSLQN